MCICLIYHSAALPFQLHLKFTVGLILSGGGGSLLSTCVHLSACVVCLCAPCFCRQELGAYSKGRSGKRSTRRVMMSHLMAGMTAAWHLSGHTRA